MWQISIINMIEYLSSKIINAVVIILEIGNAVIPSLLESYNKN